MSEMGRSDRVRGRGLGFDAVGAGTGSMITGGSSIESDAGEELIFFTAPNRLPAFLPDPEEDELAILVLLPAAIGSVIDLALSRFAFCRNLGSLEDPWPWVGVGIGDDAEGGILDFGVLLFDIGALEGTAVFVRRCDLIAAQLEVPSVQITDLSPFL